MSADSSAAHRRRKIVIAGSGFTAWFAALTLARTVSMDDYSISVLGCSQSEDGISMTGFADATLPWPEHSRVALDLDEDILVAQTGGAFSLGIVVSGWSGPDSVYFHPFSTLGASMGPLAFHQMAMKLRNEGVSLRFADYSLAALAAQGGRFQRPAKDPRSVLSTCQYGLQVNCREMAPALKALALSVGVMPVVAQLASVEYRSDGGIAVLLTEAGDRVEGDLFLDCSGRDARLIGRLAEASWEDWSDSMPCDRMLTAEADTPLILDPYSHAQAHPAGWIRHLNLQGKMALQGFYREEYMSGEQAHEQLLKAADGAELLNIQSGDVQFGRRRKLWHRNCIALGAAAANIDPVATSNLQLLRLEINRLLQLLPATDEAEVEAAEFNRQSIAQLDRARDFAQLHYRLNGRRGDPFWDACRELPLSAELDYKIKLYRSRGRVPLFDEEPLDEVSWINLFDEHGVRPAHYNPIADGFDSAELRAHIQRVRAVMIAAVKKMPSHGDYLSKLLKSTLAGSGAVE